jgi:hypothetical protein
MEEPLRSGLQEAIQAPEQRWNEQFYVSEKDGPEILYHYTSALGLHGILSHKNLRASNVLFMNDASEVMYGRQLVARVLEPRKNKIPIYNAFTGDNLLGLGDNWHIYAACFCENGDLLSQWRGYGAKGDGYSVGMSRSVLNALPCEPTQYVLFPVIYDTGIQNEMVKSAIDHAFSTVDKLKLTGEEWLVWWNEVGRQLWTSSLRFKNPVFEEEQEWRIAPCEYHHRRVLSAPDVAADRQRFRGNHADLCFAGGRSRVARNRP